MTPINSSSGGNTLRGVGAGQAAGRKHQPYRKEQLDYVLSVGVKDILDSHGYGIVVRVKQRPAKLIGQKVPARILIRG